MDLSILIVNWNTRDLLSQCLFSVYAHPPAGSFEVIVVDNASADGSAAMVRRCFSQITLIENDQNPGFAAANNQAIALSRGRYLLLLNPDTIVYPGALSALITFMDQNPAAGAAGSMLLNPDGSLQPSCHPEPTLTRELWRLFHLDKLKPYALYPMETWPADQPREVDTIQGAALLIRRSVVDEVGLLDDRYFMFSEEVDWCVRIRRAGWPIYWVPQSRVIHFGGQSTGQVATAMFVQLYRGKLQYFRNHYGAIHGLLYKGELLLAAAARLLVIPFAWLLQPTRRPDHVRLARLYGRLILSLPGM
jgi:GT2 family glycosyltransferase